MPVTLAEINACDRGRFVELLGPLFEHSPWVAEETFDRRPFQGPEHLHRELCATMQAAGEARQRALIRAHPDLAGRLARQGQLTAASAAEQQSAGLDRLNEGDLAELTSWNERYREAHGFPFVICARLNDSRSILAAIRMRAAHTREEEQATALAEIEKIAWLRLVGLLGG